MRPAAIVKLILAVVLAALNGAHDMANMPLEKEPKRVRDDLEAVQTKSSDAA
jgi:hypothetical protein